MKKLKLTLIAFGLLLTIISSGQTALTFRFANPKIMYYTTSSGVPVNGEYFEFDVQVKSNALQYLFSGEINLTFNNESLSSLTGAWVLTKGPVLDGFNSDFSPKYSILLKSIPSTGLIRIPFAGDNGSLSRTPFVTDDWNQISTTEFQTLVNIKVYRNGIGAGVAGIDFDILMNGKFSFVTGTNTISPYGANVYDPADFTTTYLGRIYANSIWTQTGGSTNGTPYTDWATPVNTSIWDGAATIPTTGVSNASNLRIHSAATLTIPANGQLTVNGDTEINSPNGLVLQSDATNTASLITASVSGTGSATVQRYLAAASWRIASSPVANQEIKQFLSANPTIATNTDNTDLRGMTDYVMATNTWSSFFSQTTAPGNVELGKGYMLRAKTTGGAGPVTFTGSLNAAPASVPLSMAGTNWNCVGNPFTSAITSANIISSNANIFEPSYAALYVFNGTSYDIVLNGVIQAGQGFFVKAVSAGSLQFNNAMKVHDNGAVLKSVDATSEIKLIVRNEDKAASTLIKFMAGASKGLDIGNDAGIFKADMELNIYTRLVEDNGIDFGLQCLPVNNMSSLVIPVGIDSKAGGEVEFSAQAINLEMDGKIILEDKLSKTFTDLSKGDYKTTLEANSSTSDRFQIHTSNQTTGISDDFFQDKLSAYAVRNTEIQVKGIVTNQAVATLYDVQGRIILVKILQEGSLNSFPTPNLRTGIYLLSVKDRGRVQRFKVPVKE